MKIVTWNVNGIRACERQGLVEWYRDYQPDVLCFQEVRAEPHQLSAAVCEPEAGCTVSWHPAEKKGYSGVGAWIRRAPEEIRLGMGLAEFDSEGRVQVLRFKGFTLFNVYFPNGSRDLSRVPYKLSFYDALLAQIKELHARGEHVIVCGDFNTAHQPIDLANPKANQKTTGFLPEERVKVDEYLAAGLKDVFRDRHPGEAGHYTWWSNRPGVRERNIGWRIDYFLVSEALVPHVTAAYILPEVKGSDHCPVVLEVDDCLVS